MYNCIACLQFLATKSCVFSAMRTQYFCIVLYNLRLQFLRLKCCIYSLLTRVVTLSSISLSESPALRQSVFYDLPVSAVSPMLT